MSSKDTSINLSFVVSKKDLKKIIKKMEKVQEKKNGLLGYK
jgi:hypothetical protein